MTYLIFVQKLRALEKLLVAPACGCGWEGRGGSIGISNLKIFFDQLRFQISIKNTVVFQITERTYYHYCCV